MILRTRIAAGLAALLAFGALSAIPAHAQFARTFDPGGTGSGPAAFTVDAAGNSYVVGTLHTDSGSSTQVVKYDHNGAIAWKHSYSRPLNDNTATAVSTDTMGNVYVAGTALAAYNQNSLIVIKYSSSGVLLWTTVRQGTEPYSGGGFINTAVVPVAVKSAPDGSVYVVGYSPVRLLYGTQYGGRWSVSKLSASGGFGVWNRNVIGTGTVTADAFNNRPSALAIDSKGNIAVSGTVRDHSPNGDTYDLEAIEYSPSGAVRWKHTSRAAGQDTFSTDLLIDPTDNVYVSSAFNAAGGGNLRTVITASYTSAGTQRWLSSASGGEVPVTLAGIVLASYGDILVGLSGEFGGLSAEEYYYDTTTGARDDGGGGPTGTFRSLALDSHNNIIDLTDGHGGLAGSSKNDFITDSRASGYHSYRGPVPGYGTPLSVQVDANDNVYVCGSAALSLNGDGSPHLGWAVVKYLP